VWDCAAGGTNVENPLCPPATRDLGAPVIELGGYQNRTRLEVWTSIMDKHGVSASGVSIGQTHGKRAGPGLPALAIPGPRVGHFVRRVPTMAHQYNGYDAGPGRFYGLNSAPRRRTARALAAAADRHHGVSVGFARVDSMARPASQIFGVKLDNGKGWVRTTPLQPVGVTSASAKSAWPRRRYELGARLRNAGVSVGRPDGVFYGTQNPVRTRIRRRMFPSGRQNGFIA